MKLYYTSVIELDRIQDRPDLSLGGFKSITPVPNASFSNLFSDISSYSIYSDREEYIGIILKNETGADVRNVKFYFDYPEGCQKILEVAATDLNAEGMMEIIGTCYSRPLYSEFYAADGVANAVELGDIADEGMIGLWFKKIVDVTTIKEQYSDLKLATDGNPEQTKEDINLIFSWEEDVETTT